MKIWNKYLFGLLSKTFLFFIVSIFLIYTIVDLSIHGVRFFSHGLVAGLEIARYYCYTFANQIGFFFPLTFLLASLKVFLDLNQHHELVALQMAGLSQKKLLSPFFAFAMLLVLTSYAHQEWLSPTTQLAANTFRSQHEKHNKKIETPHLFNVPLQDQSEMIYQDFKNNELFDVFWIKNNKDFWHIKYLKLNPSTGFFADHFQRTSSGLMEKIESFSEKVFPEIAFDPNICLESFIPFENRSLSTLLRQVFKKNSERKHVLCHLQYNLASPLVCFLILFAIAPLVIRFSRSKQGFLITAGSLFAFIAFKTILDGMMILGENQVMPSSIAIWAPLLVVFSLSLPKFIKI